MSRLSSFLWLTLALPLFAQITSGPGVRPRGTSASGGVLRQLGIADFGGAGQNSVQFVATDPSGNVYIAGTTSSPDLPVKNAAQPNFAEARILRTTDLGATWVRLGSPAEVRIVVADPIGPQILFAADDSGIYKTIDAGLSWRLVYQFQSVYSFSTPFSGVLVIDPGNHSRVAATVPSSRKFIRSLDGGENWMARDLDGGGRLSVDPAGSGILLTNYNGLSISRDWGVTFQPLKLQGPGTPSSAAFDPSHPGWIYAGTSAGVMGRLWLSTDSGVTWTEKTSPPTIFSGILHLAVDPDQPNTLVAATPDGLYTSSDGAVSWTRQSSGAFLPETHTAFAMVSHGCAAAGGLLAQGSHVGGTFSVDYSPDFGATWSTPQLTNITSVTAGPGCAFYVTRQGTSDAFVSKLAEDGSIQWTTYLGGSDKDVPAGLVVDLAGNAYVTGNTTSPDFPSTSPRIGVRGQDSVFVTKLSSDGRIEYSALIGGEARNLVSAIAVDRSQNAYLVGSTESQRFPVTPGTLQTSFDRSTGFLVKLSFNGSLVHATYLGPAYPLPSAVAADTNGETIIAGAGPAEDAPPNTGPNARFVMKLNPSASQVLSSTYIQGARPGAGAVGTTALALDVDGNLFVAGETGSGFQITPGAYASPPPSACLGESFSLFPSGDIFLVKLGHSDWKPIYRSLLRAPCGIRTGAMSVDAAGAVILALATGAGLPLRNPAVGGPACPDRRSSSAIARLSPDGSELEFATYLDNCGVPGIAAAPDGSIYVGVSSSRSTNPAGVLHLNFSNAPAVSLDQIANAFSGDSKAVVYGGLYSISGSHFSAASIDLGLNTDLPVELGGVQVTFDNLPAAILQTSPSRLTVAPRTSSAPRGNGTTRGFTRVQVFSNGVASNPVWMPVLESLPGLLTRSYPGLPPYPELADGNVRNEDGTPNDAEHPAAARSTITVFVTGMHAETPADPAYVSRSLSPVTPVTPVYSSWKGYSPVAAAAPENVYSVPGSTAALLQVRVQVPDSVQTLGGTVLDNGVRRVPLGLKLAVFPSSSNVPVSNVVAVYVK